MEIEQKAREARFLASSALLKEILDGLESDAQARIIANIRNDDHAMRVAAMEMAAIRNLRQKLTIMGKKDQDNG